MELPDFTRSPGMVNQNLPVTIFTRRRKRVGRAVNSPQMLAIIDKLGYAAQLDTEVLSGSKQVPWLVSGSFQIQAREAPSGHLQPPHLLQLPASDMSILNNTVGKSLF